MGWRMGLHMGWHMRSAYSLPSGVVNLFHPGGKPNLEEDGDGTGLEEDGDGTGLEEDGDGTASMLSRLDARANSMLLLAYRHCSAMAVFGNDMCAAGG